MNWNDLEFIDFKVNAKTGKKYYQNYLKPCFFLEINLRWTSNDEILMFHNFIIHEIGHLFNYHHNNTKTSESKFKEKEKTLNILADFLDSKKFYFWQELSNKGGVGNDKEIGGVSDAILSYWIHKTPFSEKIKTQQVEQYKTSLEAHNAHILASGIRISKMQVCFPIDFFEDYEDFFTWIINNKFIKNGTFFSGNAGYRINFWQGYVNKNASEKLSQILSEFPGLDYDVGGDKLGRVLNETKSDFLPIFKRLNWLTFISNEGVEELGGKDKLKTEIEKNGISSVYALKNGICIRACKTPALSENDPNFNQYYIIQHIISNLRFRNHPSDCEEFSDWRHKFET